MSNLKNIIKSTELIKKLGGNVPATALPSQVVIEKFIELIDKLK